MTTQIIDARNVCKDYYQYKVFSRGRLLTRALKQVSFSVREGDFFGMIGKNGAGKSTLLKILTTNLQKSSGSVKVCGYDVDKDMQKTKSNISWMFGPDYDGIGWSSVERNLRMAAAFLGMDNSLTEKRVRDVLHQFNLLKHRNMDVWRLSSGMQTKFSLAVSMLKQPRILFLDEPLLGLDVDAKDQLRELLKQLNKDGVTIVYTDHQLSEMEKVCKNVLVIDQGMVQYNGSMEDLKSKYRDTEVIDVSCISPKINQAMQLIQKDTSVIDDYQIDKSVDSFHQLRIFTKTKNELALPKIVASLHKYGVKVVQINAGLLNLEDIFRRFIRKKKHNIVLHRLRNYQIAKEVLPDQDKKQLRHSHAAVRAAAAAGLWRNHPKKTMVILSKMLRRGFDDKIAAIDAIGEIGLRQFSDELVRTLRLDDINLKMHAAMALGKLGDARAVKTIRELLLSADTVTVVLDQMLSFQKSVSEHIKELFSRMKLSELSFIQYHMNKSPHASQLLHFLPARQVKQKKLGIFRRS